MTVHGIENNKFEEVVKKALTVFKDIDRALSWLNAPCNDLGAQVPIHLFETDEGIKLVMDTLDHIEQGRS